MSSFDDFKKDLQDRLDAHLAEHPEYQEPRLLPALTGHSEGHTWAHFGNDKIEVGPSPYSEGGWIVRKNGEIERSFFEPGAWRKASKYASDLINGIQPEA